MIANGIESIDLSVIWCVGEAGFSRVPRFTARLFGNSKCPMLMKFLEQARVSTEARVKSPHTAHKLPHALIHFVETQPDLPAISALFA